ncbi:hypothetical protein Tco_1509536, partial [Tanacetum coccineum]
AHVGLASIAHFFFRTQNARSTSFFADSFFCLYKIRLWSSSAGSGIVLTSVANSVYIPMGKLRHGGEEDDEKVKNETCLVAHASSEVCSESSYFSDENSSIDDIDLDNEYDKLCKMSLKIITKNKRLKATRNNLENELRELKDKLSIFEKNKGVDLECEMCHVLKIENEKLKDESTRLNKFEKSTHCLNEMLSNQKPSVKLGLGFNSFEASSSGAKEIKFVGVL